MPRLWKAVAAATIGAGSLLVAVPAHAALPLATPTYTCDNVAPLLPGSDFTIGTGDCVASNGAGTTSFKITSWLISRSTGYIYSCPSGTAHLPTIVTGVDCNLLPRRTKVPGALAPGTP